MEVSIEIETEPALLALLPHTVFEDVANVEIVVDSKCGSSLEGVFAIVFI